MNYKIRIVSEGNPIELEMNGCVLDLVLRIFVYINNNPLESDFFCIVSTRHTEADFQSLFTALKSARNSLGGEDDMASLRLDREQNYIFERVLWYGRNFGDDIEELETFHDDFYYVSELMSPPQS